MENILTYDTWDETNFSNLTSQLKDYMDVLKWAYQMYDDKILYACSFGAEGIVMIDLISKVKPNARVVFIDTNFHFKETYELIDKMKEKYPNLNIEMATPDLTVDEQREQYGHELWKNNPNLCCSLRKINPLSKELAGVQAWISGLRREQSPTRKNIEYVNKDERFNKIKICPLIHWAWQDIWNYIKLNHLPYNRLHDQDYPSIGCEHCTLPVKNGEDSRAGRWANSQKTECGLHQAR